MLAGDISPYHCCNPICPVQSALMKLRAIGLTALLLVLLTGLLFSEPISQLKPTGYVNDFAHVIDADTAAKITNIAQQIDQKAHAQIALVTINSLDGNDIESYAVDLYKKWGIGYKGTDRGVLILYAIKDHRARIEVGYGLEPILPDGKVGGFQREAIPLMQAGKYSNALFLVTGRVADVIANDAGVQLTGEVPSAPTLSPGNSDQPIPTGLIIFGIIVFIFLLSTSWGRALLFWMLLSGRGGGGGGGFGGFGGGGGGGFGGFGGGSSGGGGASSSW